MNQNVNGRQLHEQLNIKVKHAVSIIGGCVDKNIFEESRKKYTNFLENLLKYVRSTDSCLITDCSEPENDIINLSESIGKKILANPYYYDSKENKKVRLIGVRSIEDLKKEIKRWREMTDEQAEEAILLNKRDERGRLPGDTMLPRFHTDFIFTNTEEEAQKLRFKFEIKFDFVTYVLINVNREAEFKYLDKIILDRYKFKIVYVTVS